MSFVPGAPPPLRPAERRALHRLAAKVRPLTVPSPAVALTAAASEWLVIGLAVASTFWVSSPWWWAGVGGLIGARQHGLLILMHEGVHHRLHGQPELNDLLSDLLCAWPLFASTRAYRQSHLLHHRHLHTERDPDWLIRHDGREWAYPARPAVLLWRLLVMASGGGLFAFVKGNRRMRERGVGLVDPERHPLQLVARVGVTLAIPVGCVVAGEALRLVLFWLLPFVTVMPALVRFRVIGEHYGLPATSTFDTTRDWTAGAVLDWLLVPWNIRLHLTHHLFAAVPFHRLPEAQRLLHADAEVGERCHRTVGLGALVEELSTSGPGDR